MTETSKFIKGEEYDGQFNQKYDDKFNKKLKQRSIYNRAKEVKNTDEYRQ